MSQSGWGKPIASSQGSIHVIKTHGLLITAENLQWVKAKLKLFQPNLQSDLTDDQNYKNLISQYKDMLKRAEAEVTYKAGLSQIHQKPSDQIDITKKVLKHEFLGLVKDATIKEKIEAEISSSDFEKSSDQESKQSSSQTQETTSTDDAAPSSPRHSM